MQMKSISYTALSYTQEGHQPEKRKALRPENASDLCNSGAGQGLIKDRLTSGSALQPESWHSHGAHRGIFPLRFWR